MTFIEKLLNWLSPRRRRRNKYFIIANALVNQSSFIEKVRDDAAQARVKNEIYRNELIRIIVRLEKQK